MIILILDIFPNLFWNYMWYNYVITSFWLDILAKYDLYLPLFSIFPFSLEKLIIPDISGSSFLNMYLPSWTIFNILLLQFSSVVSYFVWPHGLLHIRLPRPSPTPEVCPNSCPSSWWCHPTISSFVIPFQAWLSN